MENVISIRGEIGWDVTANSVREQLQGMKGQDITVEINSPGGFVMDGVDIFNQLRRHDGKVTTHIYGLAASMAAYIAMAGQSLKVEDNSVFMIHNVWGVDAGDHNSFRKAADIMENLSKMLGRAYAKKTGKSIEEVQALMDSESWFYGEQIKKEGFADVVEKAGGGPANMGVAKALAYSRFKAMEEKLRNEKKVHDIPKLAALLTDMKTDTEPGQGIQPEIAPSASAPEPEKPANTSGVQAMNKEQLKKDHPALYAEIFDEGVASERERVKELWAYVEGDPDNANLRAIVEPALLSGATEKDVRVKCMVAIRSGGGAGGENPPNVTTETRPEGAALSPEEAQICKELGITAEQFRGAKVPEPKQ